jgi:hypothetical protein
MGMGLVAAIRAKECKAGTSDECVQRIARTRGSSTSMDLFSREVLPSVRRR